MYQLKCTKFLKYLCKIHPKVLLLCAVLLLSPSVASAADGMHINGAELSIFWILPFVGVLCSVAFFPLLIPQIWHVNYGKICFAWALLFLLPYAFVYGHKVALYQVWHSMALEYIPFIILLFTLFTIAGGIRFTGKLVGTPLTNTGILVSGLLLASWMGTTGASMLLIRPFLRANAHRKYRVHGVMFFIFIVANIGGSLSPLGDPPLFLGFLKGVDFFWPLQNLFLPFIIISTILLLMFFLMDTYFFKREGSPKGPVAEDDEDDATTKEKFGIDGKINFLFILAVIGAVLFSGTVKLGSFTLYHVSIEISNIVRDLILLFLVRLSLKFTSHACRQANGFDWEPIREVAKIFVCIFICIVPAITILQAGADGALAPIINLLFQDGAANNFRFFWITGFLSCFLDNAPTYMVFFNAAGGDASVLMHEMQPTLVAISIGTIFMGANTYIANAPNFMIRAIAEIQGVRMPSFFAFMLCAAVILFPIYLLLTLTMF